MTKACTSPAGTSGRAAHSGAGGYSGPITKSPSPKTPAAIPYSSSHAAEEQPDPPSQDHADRAWPSRQLSYSPATRVLGQLAPEERMQLSHDLAELDRV